MSTDSSSSSSASSSSSNAAQQPIDPRLDFFAGTVAGAAGLIVGQPFDTIKVRFQSVQFKGRYTSTFHAFYDIVKKEKPRGLFKGVTSPMASIPFINGVIFTTYSFLMSQLHLYSPTYSDKGKGKGLSIDDKPPIWMVGLAGSGAGIAGSMLETPSELVKIHQQSLTHIVKKTSSSASTSTASASVKKPPPTSTIQIIRGIVKQQGVKGLYRGFLVTAFRDTSYGPYFMTYEGLCRFFRSQHSSSKPTLLRYDDDLPIPPNQPHHHESLIEEAEEELHTLGWAELMFAGGAAGVVSWFATFPLDVLKTRIQAYHPLDAQGPPQRRRIWTTASEAVKKEGWRVLFVGLSPTLIRAIPSNMVIFLTFEMLVAGLR